MKYLFIVLLISFTLSEFTLPPLPYPYHELEPIIDSETMKLHHDKHHQTYLDNLQKVIPKENTKTIEEILQNLSSQDESIRTILRNHGGGFYNHNLFWKLLQKPTEVNKPAGNLESYITTQYGSFEKFQDQFTKASLGLFGSGWVFFTYNTKTKRLEISSHANQDNPLMNGKEFVPILALDVWEHAYYLKYQNRRADYVNNWWKIVNWTYVEQRLLDVIQPKQTPLHDEL